jgi:hypothetical protein
MIPSIEVNFLIRYFESRPSDRVDHDQNRRRPSLPAAESIGGGSPQLNKARKNGRWPVSDAGGYFESVSGLV